MACRSCERGGRDDGSDLDGVRQDQCRTCSPDRGDCANHVASKGGMDPFIKPSHVRLFDAILLIWTLCTTLRPISPQPTTITQRITYLFLHAPTTRGAVPQRGKTDSCNRRSVLTYNAYEGKSTTRHGEADAGGACDPGSKLK